jgi:hypothetical protein
VCVEGARHHGVYTPDMLTNSPEDNHMRPKNIVNIWNNPSSNQKATKMLQIQDCSTLHISISSSINITLKYIITKICWKPFVSQWIVNDLFKATTLNSTPVYRSKEVLIFKASRSTRQTVMSYQRDSCHWLGNLLSNILNSAD